jgi:hypothetical protein
MPEEIDVTNAPGVAAALTCVARILDWVADLHDRRLWGSIIRSGLAGGIFQAEIISE